MQMLVIFLLLFIIRSRLVGGGATNMDRTKGFWVICGIGGGGWDSFPFVNNVDDPQLHFPESSAAVCWALTKNLGLA